MSEAQAREAEPAGLREPGTALGGVFPALGLCVLALGSFAPLLPSEEGALLASWLTSRMAGCCAWVAFLLFGVVLVAGAAEKYQGIRIARWTYRGGGVQRWLLGAAVGLSLGGTALAPRWLSGAAAARSSQGLALAALLILSGSLCIHLRASLVRARYWVATGSVALTGLAAVRAAGDAFGGNAVSALLLAGASALLASLSGRTPGRGPADETPQGELAALAFLALATSWTPSTEAMAFLVGAALLRHALRLGPSVRLLLCMATAALAALFFSVPGGPLFPGGIFGAALLAASASLAAQRSS